MKLLKDILFKAGLTKVIGTTDVEIVSICFDSRHVGINDLFIAVKGTQVDGHVFIDKAINSGAIAIVCQEIPKDLAENITYIRVSDSAYALGIIASNYYDNPSSELKLVGVTGTNGKTTIVTLLYKLFRSLGYSVGLLSTVENKIDNEIIESTHTTPDPIQLNRLLSEMADRGCNFCFMEVSSHAIHQKRIAGLEFVGGIFTNITHDHLDYHKTFDEYIKAKKKFFDDLPKKAFALTNVDDKNGKIMIQNTKAKTTTYSLKSLSNFKARIIENQFDGLVLNIDKDEVYFKLIGEFNAYNLMAIYATAILLGEDKNEVLTMLSNIETAEGRFDFFISDSGIIAIVDYAHTPDALKNVLKTINSIRTRNEQLITVVGAGGDRDTSKRPLMANVSGELSDKVILTSDNPRSEDPEDIISQMQKGVEPLDYKKVISIVNRKEAIKTACALATKGDIILVAGKGHEKYQDIKGVKHPFDDKKILKELLNVK
ncbi:MAG: UDP-N-acetylmuramoyl-L-alanyl-D-glutamate--2,6-diaminopimelate ligase [Saprospiraceae bacterium]|nr:UDP-N-acetylmuramoyl-L-alanyl-D-glutamate--2,6-diaminopimelate ligase [Saprospiraceae bacterium]